MYKCLQSCPVKDIVRCGLLIGKNVIRKMTANQQHLGDVGALIVGTDDFDA
jgi:hypothetical protein